MRTLEFCASVPALVVAGMLGACVTSGEQVSKARPVDVLLRADRAFEMGSYEQARHEYSIAAAAADEAGDDETFVEALAQTASTLALLERPSEAEPWLDRAVSQARTEAPRGFSRVLLARGLLARARGAADEAAQRFEELYAFCLASEQLDRAMQAATLATVVTTGESQLFWSRRAVEAAVRAGNRRWEAGARLAEGWTYDAQNKLPEARDAFQAAREIANELGDLRGRIRAEWAYARALRRTGDLAEARLLQQRNLDAVRTLRQRSWTLNDSEWVGRCHQELAEIEAAGSHYDLALKHMASAREAFVLAEAESLAPEVLRKLDERVAELQREH